MRHVQSRGRSQKTKKNGNIGVNFAEVGGMCIVGLRDMDAPLIK